MLGKRISIYIILILAILLLADFALARELEVPLPQAGGESAITETPLLPAYVKYVFNFGIGIAGLIAFLMTTYGGFRYLTSAGDPSKMGDANSQIFAGAIGLIVILGSWLLLTTINPQLIVINPELKESGLVVGDMPGVYLCKEQTGDPVTNCDGSYLFDKNSLSSDFDDKTKYVRFENPEGITYGVILHKDKYLKGECEVVLSNIGSSVIPVQELNNKGGVSSISVFKQDPGISGGSVTLCENRDCKKTNTDDTKEAKRLFTFEEGLGTFKSSVLRGFPDLQTYNYENGDQIDGGLTWGRNKGVSALEVANYMAILFRDDNYSGICDIFNIGDPALGSGGDVIGNDHASSMMILKGKK